MQNATWDGTDRKVFTVPVALSLMVFFALCCQCASTLAVIQRETDSWRWPVFTFAYMTVLAYVGGAGGVSGGPLGRFLRTTMVWQLVIVAVIVAAAAWYIARATWRTWSGRKSGCGGGCGCGSKTAAEQKGTVIPVEQITLRRRGPG